MGKRDFDIIIWGATGFTGKLVTEFLSTLPSLSLAVGGRNKDGLDSLLSSLSLTSKVSVVVADVGNDKSLDAAFSRASVVLTCAGPFSKIGFPVVASCVRVGTHYCDITGELPFVRKTIDAFHKEAQEKEIKIVHCCGFDSVPSDIGTLFMHREALRLGYKGISSANLSYAKINGGISGGTLASAINMIVEHPVEAQKMSKNSYYIVDREDRKGGNDRDQKKIVFDKVLNSWSYPFFMSVVNSRIVRRSNSLFAQPYSPVFKYNENSVTRSYFKAFLTTFATVFFFMTLMFKFTRNLMIKYVIPKQGTGPSRELLKNGNFTGLLYAVPFGAENVVIRGKVTGGEPGYWQTARMIGLSAVCLAKGEADPECLKGGVLTPASAIGLKLADRLKDHGMKFEITK